MNYAYLYAIHELLILDFLKTEVEIYFKNGLNVMRLYALLKEFSSPLYSDLH